MLFGEGLLSSNWPKAVKRLKILYICDLLLLIMIFGIGTDIIEVGRMERHLNNSEALRDKLFTEREQAYANDKASMYQHYAARFAAKEAFFKALGTGYRFGMAFCEIEVINDDLGKPVIHVYGKVKEFIEKQGIKSIHLSISHVKEMANAFVVLEV